MAQNQELDMTEAHFFCADNNMPYYARMTRGYHVEWFKISSGNVACFNLEFHSYELEGEGPKTHPELCFDQDKYIKMVMERRELLNLISDFEEESLKHRIKHLCDPLLASSSSANVF
jgi:hypothetical protein